MILESSSNVEDFDVEFLWALMLESNGFSKFGDNYQL